MIFTSKVIKEDDDIVMLLQPELLEKLALEEDTVYAWELREDGSFLVKPLVKSNIQ